MHGFVILVISMVGAAMVVSAASVPGGNQGDETGDGREGEWQVHREIDIIEIIRKHREWSSPRRGGKPLDGSLLGDRVQIYDGSSNLLKGPAKGSCTTGKSDLSAKCCFNASVSILHMKMPVNGCASVHVDIPKKQLQIDGTFDGVTIANATLALDAPSPLCFDVKLAKLCAVFYNVDVTKGFHGCVDVDVTFLEQEVRVASSCW